MGGQSISGLSGKLDPAGMGGSDEAGMATAAEAAVLAELLSSSGLSRVSSSRRRRRRQFLLVR